METLTQMKCVACRRDAPTVTDAEINELHPHVSDWEIETRLFSRRLQAIALDALERLPPQPETRSCFPRRAAAISICTTSAPAPGNPHSGRRGSSPCGDRTT
jgi:hypothetical protein